MFTHRRTATISGDDDLRLVGLIGVDGDDTVALVEAGIVPPPPVRVTAVIDTGSTRTSVSGAVLRTLGAARLRDAESQTAGGRVLVGVYSISLGLYLDDAETQPVVVVSDLIVSELPVELPGLDVLLGVDVLNRCRLTIDGPARSFALEF